MGSALMKGFITSGHLKATQIFVSDPDAEILQKHRDRGVTAVSSNREVCKCMSQSDACF